jgi:hypothetical protein
MKEAVFWVVAPCRYFVNRCFGGAFYLHFRVEEKKKILKRKTSVRR